MQCAIGFFIGVNDEDAKIITKAVRDIVNVAPVDGGGLYISAVTGDGDALANALAAVYPDLAYNGTIMFTHINHCGCGPSNFERVVNVYTVNNTGIHRINTDTIRWLTYTDDYAELIVWCTGNDVPLEASRVVAVTTNGEYRIGVARNAKIVDEKTKRPLKVARWALIQ